jgi:Cytochrome c554 and c-prime
MAISPKRNPHCRHSRTHQKTCAGVRRKLACALFFVGLTAGASCVPTAPRTAPAGKQGSTKAEALTVFFTGGTLGALKPCGCSGGQLGGLERRQAVFDTVPGPERLVVDTGSFVKSDREQDLIKYNIIVQALQLLHYDVASLSEKDVEIGRNLDLLDSAALGLHLIGPPYGAANAGMPAKFTKELALDGKTVVVTIAAFDAKTESVERVRQLFAPHAGAQSLNILILNQCNADMVKSVTAAAPSVDCLVCSTQSDEPVVIGDPNDKPLVFSVGQFGRHICKLQAESTGGRDGWKLSLDVIPVSENLKREPSLVSLYKDYQQVVRESNLLEKYPRFALPDNLQYVGSLSCKPCHDSEYEKWQSTHHAKAYATLEQVGSEADPECVVCHTVGMDYESGFVSPEKSGHLEGVGCENCHGPGSEHVRSGGRVKSAGPKSTCTDCHTPEQSGEYAGNERAFLEKIIHWKEPSTADHVK